MAPEPNADPAAKTEPGRSRRKSSKAAEEKPRQNSQGLKAEQEDLSLDLSFREAQTAFELALAELQSADLDIERMTTLYNRARAYADRCDAVLRQVEQDVMQWDPDDPETPPKPYGS